MPTASPGATARTPLLRISAHLLLPVVVCLALAACGSDDNDNGDGNGGNGPPDAPTAQLKCAP